MPELPEVECVRRSIGEAAGGRRVLSVDLRRADVLQPAVGMRRGGSPADVPIAPGLLLDRRVARVVRHGKRLAIVGDDGSAVGVHLGMSGRLLVVDPATDASDEPFGGAHTHAVWRLDDGRRMLFVDHRRFGGLWDWPAEASDATWFAGLGPDALVIGPTELWRALRGTRRGLKAALLDQAVVAGLGNIYIDELLYAARLNPLKPAATVTREQAAGLVRRMRTLLTRAIESGGSTLRDYQDAHGEAGGYQQRHRVYGRVGLPCTRRACRTPLIGATVAGRTTAWCPRCQPSEGH